MAASVSMLKLRHKNQFFTPGTHMISCIHVHNCFDFFIWIQIKETYSQLLALKVWSPKSTHVPAKNVWNLISFFETASVGGPKSASVTPGLGHIQPFRAKWVDIHCKTTLELYSRYVSHHIYMVFDTLRDKMWVNMVPDLYFAQWFGWTRRQCMYISLNNSVLLCFLLF